MFGISCNLSNPLSTNLPDNGHEWWVMTDDCGSGQFTKAHKLYVLYDTIQSIDNIILRIGMWKGFDF